MRVLNDYTCPNGHKHEYFLENEQATTPCTTCGEPAKKLIPAVRSKLDWISGDFPGATMKWTKAREQKLQQEKRHSSYEGD